MSGFLKANRPVDDAPLPRPVFAPILNLLSVSNCGKACLDRRPKLPISEAV